MKTETGPTPGAVKVAQAIMAGAKSIDTTYGRKSVIGLADMIDRANGVKDLRDACQQALEVMNISEVHEAMRLQCGHEPIQNLSVALDNRQTRPPHIIRWAKYHTDDKALIKEILTTLVARSIAFTLTPYPDDQYVIEVKANDAGDWMLSEWSLDMNIERGTP